MIGIRACGGGGGAGLRGGMRRVLASGAVQKRQRQQEQPATCGDILGAATAETPAGADIAGGGGERTMRLDTTAGAQRMAPGTMREEGRGEGRD